MMDAHKTGRKGDCGTCRWYQKFLDLCKALGKTNERIFPARKSKCELWEEEQDGVD